jgi:hypothetical protein
MYTFVVLGLYKYLKLKESILPLILRLSLDFSNKSPELRVSAKFYTRAPLPVSEYE